MNPTTPINSLPDNHSPFHLPPFQPSGPPPRAMQDGPASMPGQGAPPHDVLDPLRPIDLLSITDQVGDMDPVESAADTIRQMISVLKEKKASLNSPTTATVRLADVPQRGVEWLWPDRIPIGKITLIVGDPGVGKSLIVLDIAARVTTGRAWPEAEQGAESSEQGEELSDSRNPEPGTLNPPASVLLLSAEDDLADTIRPRLEALDADCTRIVALTSSRTNKMSCAAGPPPVPRPLSPVSSSIDLSRDVALFDHTLDSLPDCKLVIIDPISAYLGRAMENVNAEVRRVMAPLAELAERRRVAIVVVSHLRKQAGAAVHRAIGSLAFVAAARTAWLVTKDSKTSFDYTPERRLLLPIKNNIAPDTAGLACSIESHPHAGLPIVRWSNEPLDVDADEALLAAKPSAGRPAEDRNEAARWLQTQLAGGPLPSAEVEESAVAHGFSAKTVRRAFRHLGGEALKSGFGSQSKWYWRLPSKDAHNPRPNSGHLCTDPQKNDARPVC